jgi:hypothetical protein
MDGHLVPASSNSKFRCSLENFTLDAERWLAALYWCVRTSYGEDAAHAAADCWLRVFEEQLEGSSDLPELTRITAAAIDAFIEICSNLSSRHKDGKRAQWNFADS